MPFFLMKLAAGIGIPARFQKAAIIGAGALLLLLAIFAAVKIHDHRVIAAHEAKQDAANAKADRKADTKAAEQRRADDTRLTQEAGQLKEVQANAKTNHDRSLARARCIRMQQSARAAKRQPPDCVGPGVPSGASRPH
jgi:hypothetical protein